MSVVLVGAAAVGARTQDTLLLSYRDPGPALDSGDTAVTKE